MASVYLHVWKAWLSAAGRETSEVQWRQDLTLEQLVPERMRGAKGLKVFINKMECSLEQKPGIGDHVDIAIMPSADPVTFGVVGAFLVNTAITIGLNFIISAIIGRPKGPKIRGDQESAHAAWSGVQNTRVEGQPRQVVYGRFRVAPMILDEFVSTVASPSTSTLHTLGMISEGPISKIGDQVADNPIETPLSSEDPANPIPSGIQINGNSLDGFRDVEAHVRMGTSDQEPVPGFEQIVTDYEVGATLMEDETHTVAGQKTLNTALDLVIVPYYSNSAGAQALWDKYAFGYDLRERADQFTCLVTFPQGLYSVNTGSGDLEDAGFQALIRYRELDEAGLAIESGGDNGDGWVYVFPEMMLLAHTQHPFGKEYSGTFQDPGQYVPGSLGRALLFDGANDYASTNLGTNDSMLEIPTTWNAGNSVPEITIMGWVQFFGIPDGLTPDYRPILEMSDPGSTHRGIGMYLQRALNTLGNAAYWVPVLYLGNGTTVNQFREQFYYSPQHYVPSTSSSGASSYHHMATTYKHLPDGNVRVAIYLDGRLAITRILPFTTGGFVATGKALEMGRSRTSTFSGPKYSHLAADEFRVLQRELTASEISADYRAGTGIYGVNNADLVAGWHFDETPAVITMEDYGSFNSVPSHNDLRLYSGATTGLIGSGKVVVPGSGPTRRSRYRVEMLRLNLKGATSLITDESAWSVVMGLVSAQLAYPNLALIGTKIRANDQLSGSSPTSTVLVEGKLCPVWDGNSTNNPSITYQWTRNPAWICLDVATNKRYGSGATYNFQTVNLPSVKEWADYCDELIYDNRGGRQAIDESGSTAPIFDLRYDSTLFDGFGGIEVFYRTTPLLRPTRRWVVGRHIAFSGIPAPSGSYLVDINSTNIPGFEIGEVISSPGWNVRIKFDKARYGHPWTDGQFLSTVLAASLTGTVEGREPRFQYDWTHDTFKGMWDTLIDIGATARAMPFRDGRILRFKIEKPRTPVGIIGMGQIKAGSFEMDYVGGANRPNSLQADYWDEDKNWDRANVSMDDPALAPQTDEQFITRDSITLEGVTRRSQSKRDLFFRLLVNRLLARSGKFTAGLETLAFEVGDVFQLAHDMVPWGKSGRLLAASTTTNLVVDRRITLKVSKTYYAKVRSMGQFRQTDGTITDRYETILVTAAAGTYQSGDTISINALSFTPAKDYPYVIYSTDEIVLVQIASISLAEKTDRDIEWIDYDEAVYDCDVLPEPITG